MENVLKFVAFVYISIKLLSFQYVLNDIRRHVLLLCVLPDDGYVL